MSYCAVYLNRIHREKNLPEKPEDPLVLEKAIPYDAEFSFVDFVPSVMLYSSSAHEVEYHRFSHLVETANAWIQKNSHWRIINCETVLLYYRHNVTSMVSRWEQQINPVTPLWSPNSKGEFETVLKALRLWIQRRDDQNNDYNDDEEEEEEEDPEDQDDFGHNQPLDNQDDNGGSERRTPGSTTTTIPYNGKLRYLDFIPKRRTENSFETIDDLLARINHRLRQHDTFYWNLITLESLKVEANSDWIIDPEISLADESSRHLTILRLFYEEITAGLAGGSLDSEAIFFNEQLVTTVGIEDFKPRLLSGGSFFKRPEFEPFSALVQRASKWLLAAAGQSPTAHFLNAQSIDVKIKSLTKLDTRICTNIENGDYIQFLRIIYCKILPRLPAPSLRIGPSLGDQPMMPRPKSTEPIGSVSLSVPSTSPSSASSPVAGTNHHFEMLRLNSKVFVATKLDHPLDSVQQRIYHWLQNSNNNNNSNNESPSSNRICIMGAETVYVYAKDDDERVLEKKCGECFHGNRLGSLNTYTFTAVRLYYCMTSTTGDRKSPSDQHDRSRRYRDSPACFKTFPQRRQSIINRNRNNNIMETAGKRKTNHHHHHHRFKTMTSAANIGQSNSFKEPGSANQMQPKKLEKQGTVDYIKSQLNETTRQMRNRSTSCNLM